MHKKPVAYDNLITCIYNCDFTRMCIYMYSTNWLQIKLLLLLLLIYKILKFCQSLEELQNRIIITIIDKASNNCGIICRKYYIGVLKKELGSNYSDIKGNDIYLPFKENIDKLLSPVRKPSCCLHY